MNFTVVSLVVIGEACIQDSFVAAGHTVQVRRSGVIAFRGGACDSDALFGAIIQARSRLCSFSKFIRVVVEKNEEWTIP
jgi:hypothetical protein